MINGIRCAVTTQQDIPEPKAMNRKETSPLAIASLAFSCLGALTMGILCIPGIVCGILAKGQVRRGEYGGHSLAQAGIIVGIAVLIMWGTLPALFLGGSAIRFFVLEQPWIGAIAFSIILILGLLPFAFTSIAKRKDNRALNRLMDQNRHRG
jgi:hypothetical protein